MKEEYLELLKELIRERPVSSDVAAVNRVVARVRSFLDDRGIHCVVENLDGRDILYASTRPGKTQDVLFNAHLDVVPAMSDDQFEPLEKDGRLHARGAGDCLGNVVAIIQALVERGEAFSAGAVFSTDEEIGGETARVMVDRGYGARKAVIVADHFEDCKITYRQKGVLILKLTARGQGGHAAYIFDPARNPIDTLAKGYLKLRENWKNPTDPDDWRDSMNACVVKGGAAFNQIPDEAEMLINIRYTRPGDKDAIVERVKAISGLEADVVKQFEPVTGNPEDPAYEIMRKCHEKVFPNREIGFSGMCGATDARHFIKLGVPAIILAAAGFGAHSAEECVVLDSIDKYAQVFSEFIAAAGTIP